MNAYYRPQYTALYLRRESYARYAGGDWGFRPDGSEVFSITIWFWPDNANARLLDGEGVLTLDLMDDRLVFWLKGYTDLVCIAERYPLLRHEWNHVTITYSHEGQIFFYINGLQTAVYSIFQGTPAKKWDSILFCPGMEGYLRSVQFFNRQLSEEEVDQVKRVVKGAPVPVRWFDFETALPKERMTGAPITLLEDAKPYALADGLFCDAGDGFFPLDGDQVNPGAYQDAPYTVQAWISIYSDQQSFAVLFLNGRHTLDCGMVLYLEKRTDGYYLCAGRGAHTRQENILCSTRVIPTRSWHSVAVTYDGADMRLYIDGALEGVKQKSEMTPFTEQMDYGLLRIGTDDLPGLTDGEGCFHGAFGNIAVWKRALTAEDLKRYADNPPHGDEDGLTANYTFSRYTCCNLANGFELSTAGVDTSKICRNPIQEDPVRDNPPKAPPLPDGFTHLHGKSVHTLHQERAAALPAAQTIVHALLEDVANQNGVGFDTLLAEIEQELSLRRTGEGMRPFYLYERLEDGRYQFYLVSDRIYPAGILEQGKKNEFTVWLIRLISTIIIDVLSIYSAVPKGVSTRIPEALRGGLLQERESQLFNTVRDISFKKLVATVCKFLMGGGLLIQIVEQLQREGIWVLGANLATMVASFLVKASSAWGWVMVVTRVAFLVVDVYSLYQDMPKILGAELIRLSFSTGNVFVPAACTPGAKLTQNWEEGQKLDDASPVVCCLRQARAEQITLSAQFAVYTDGTYRITASAESFPFGTIEESAVQLKAGKDGTCTVRLTFRQGTLKSTKIGESVYTLKWTISGGHITTTQETTMRFLLIYDAPQAPWGDKNGFGTPWTEVLRIACSMANGVTGDTDILWQSALQKAIIGGLWSCCKKYEQEAVYVSGTRLYLTRWLADLRGDGVSLHAHDCAALMVALCNLLGCGFSSVLMCGAGGKPMTTRQVVRIGSGVSPQSYQMECHEAVMTLRGTHPFFSDPCYQLPGEKEQELQPLVMLPFYTEEAETGFCNLLLTEPKLCQTPNDQRAIGNGRRTIL